LHAKLFGASMRAVVAGCRMINHMCAVQGAARLAEGLLDALGVEKAVVVGHSAGKPSSCPRLPELWRAIKSCCTPILHCCPAVCVAAQA